MGRAGACGAVVLGCGLDGVQGGGSATDGVAHHGLQLSARIDAGAVIKGVGNGLLHGGQVVGGHAGDAQGVQLGLGGRGVGGYCAADHRLGRSGQGLELGYGVHCRRGRGVDHIAEQTGAGGARQAGHTNGGEGRGTAQGAVIVGRAVGCAQDGLVRVDDGLDFCGGVGARAVHVVAVQSIVDGGEVGGGDAGDTGGGVNALGRAGGCGGVVLGGGLDGGQGGCGATNRVVHHGLQICQCINIGARVVSASNGLLHGSEVVGAHAGDAQFGEVVHAQGRVGGAAGGLRCGSHHAFDDGCQGIKLVNRIDLVLGAGAHGVIEQAQVLCVGGGVAQGHADSGVGRGHRVSVWRGIRRVAIGLCQDGVVGVDDGLDFFCGVGACAVYKTAVQRRVDCGEVVAGNAGDTCGGIYADIRAGGGGGVVLSSVSDGVDCAVVVGNCLVDHCLQLSQGIDAGAVVGGGVNGFLYVSEVFACDLSEPKRGKVF